MKVQDEKLHRHLSRESPLFLREARFISTVNGIPATIVVAGLTIRKKKKKLQNVPFVVHLMLNNTKRIRNLLLRTVKP
jgi:hypothetical protein